MSLLVCRDLTSAPAGGFLSVEWQSFVNHSAGADLVEWTTFFFLRPSLGSGGPFRVDTIPVGARLVHPLGVVPETAVDCVQSAGVLELWTRSPYLCRLNCLCCLIFRRLVSSVLGTLTWRRRRSSFRWTWNWLEKTWSACRPISGLQEVNFVD
jgi:hypothetical protein